MRNPFQRKKRHAILREIAQQLTAPQRYALELPGVPPGGLPYNVYDQMEGDSMIQTALTVKKLGVLAAPYKLIPASDSAEAQRIAQFVEAAFERMVGSPHTVLLQAMDAFSKGWSVQELVFEASEGRIWLKGVRPKDPSLFGLDVDEFGNIRSLRLQLPGESPEDLPRGKFVVYLNRPGYGRPKGRSDLDAAHKHWKVKNTLLAAWGLHLERFASPTVLGKFERGLSAEEQAAILSALQDLAKRSAIIYPEEITVDTLGGQKEASTGFMEAVEFHNREMVRSILGQTLTTDEGKRVGSLALGKVHLQVLLLQLEAVRRELADTVMTEQVIRPLVELNFGKTELPRFEFEPTLLSAFASGDIA